jgi:hypothetical protein
MPQYFYQPTGRYTRDASGRQCQVYDLYIAEPGSGEGLGDWKSIFSKVGSVIAPFATLIPVAGPYIAQGVAVAAGAAGASAAAKEQNKQLADQFNAKAIEANELFHAIQIKPAGTVTQADYNAAKAVYDQLAQAASQFPNLAAMWESSAYKPAYDHGLLMIAGMIPGGVSTGAAASDGAITTAALNVAGFEIPVWAIAAVALVFVLKR